MASTDLVTEAQIDALVAKVAEKLNAEKTVVGDLASLTTTVKTSIVLALNSLVASQGAVIADGATAGTSTWSSTKIADAISTGITSAVSGILGGADAAYNTLKELQDLMQADDTAMSGLTTLVGQKLSITAQTLTSPEKAQVLANIGIARSVVDFATALQTAVG